MSSLLEQARQCAGQWQAVKQELHRHPELSFQEVQTTALIRFHLTRLGLELVDLGMETGVVALLRGDLPGPAVALRADIDAIAQQERGDGICSQVPGVMHGCGHDLHTACLLGAAELLSQRRASLPGTVVFLFQPAEELTQGAAAMVQHGLWEKLPVAPVAMFGLHNRPQIPAGQVAVMEGPVMAGKCHFTIDLHGLAGHGGAPQNCVDVIVAGAAIVGGLQTIVSRNADPLESLVCSVCSIHAGTPENFVPETLRMTGSLRAHSESVLANAQTRLRELAEGIGGSYGCQVEVAICEDVGVTWNSPSMTRLARMAAEEVVGADRIVSPRPDMGSEDFSLYGQFAPTFFYWLGSGFEDRELPGWHHPAFCTNDEALPIGAALLAQSAISTLEQETI